MINIVGAHYGPRELLKDVVILVGGLGRGNGGKLFSLVFGKSVSHQVQSLIPAYLNKFTVPLHQW